MNFLAHIYLSGDDEDLLLGNFIADHVKGKKYELYPPRVKQGILLHRFIDDFTDNHPIVLESKKLFWPKYHKLAPILTDMAYDHYLAVNWGDYHEEDLKEFTQKTYKLLIARSEEMPERVQFMLTYMAQHDWLYNYRFEEGMRRSLGGLSKRVQQGDPLANGWDDINDHYRLLEQQFRAFFEELKEASKQKRP